MVLSGALWVLTIGFGGTDGFVTARVVIDLST